MTITHYNVWFAIDDMGGTMECRWHGSHTVNVYAGIASEDGDSMLDPVEIDVFTLYPQHGGKPTFAEVDEACRDYLSCMEGA